MRSQPKMCMPVVLKHTKDKDVPVMFINDLNGVEKTDGVGQVECVWVDKNGAPYKAKFHTDMLEKFTPAKEEN